MRKKRSVTLLLMLCTILGLRCDNPFLPPTGTPVKFPSNLPADLRSTPQGLLAQLIESYESMRIDLFTDLLPTDGSFRFFITQGFFSENQDRFRQRSEPPDGRLQYLEAADSYHYWTQTEEIDKHTRMFRSALNIDFKAKPGIESIRRFVDNGDSLAELKITGGEFWLLFSTAEGDSIITNPVAIEKQVFLIQQDAGHRWVIKKWYDFGSSD
jgi:hypothetical protein